MVVLQLLTFIELFVGHIQISRLDFIFIHLLLGGRYMPVTLDRQAATLLQNSRFKGRRYYFGHGSLRFTGHECLSPFLLGEGSFDLESVLPLCLEVAAAVLDPRDNFEKRKKLIGEGPHCENGTFFSAANSFFARCGLKLSALLFHV